MTCETLQELHLILDQHYRTIAYAENAALSRTPDMAGKCSDDTINVLLLKSTHVLASLISALDANEPSMVISRETVAIWRRLGAHGQERHSVADAISHYDTTRRELQEGAVTFDEANAKMQQAHWTHNAQRMRRIEDTARVLALREEVSSTARNIALLEDDSHCLNRAVHLLKQSSDDLKKRVAALEDMSSRQVARLKRIEQHVGYGYVSDAATCSHCRTKGECWNPRGNNRPRHCRDIRCRG